jgi:hypothetical protein
MHGFLTPGVPEEVSDANLPCVHNAEARGAAGELTAAECVDVFGLCLERHIMGRLAAFLQEERAAVESLDATLDSHIHDASASLEENRSRIAKLGQLLDQCQNTMGSFGGTASRGAQDSSGHTALRTMENAFPPLPQPRPRTKSQAGARASSSRVGPSVIQRAREHSNEHQAHSRSAGSSIGNKSSDDNNEKVVIEDEESEADQNAKLIEAVDAIEAGAESSPSRGETMHESGQDSSSNSPKCKGFGMVTGGKKRRPTSKLSVHS